MAASGKAIFLVRAKVNRVEGGPWPHSQEYNT